MDQIMRLRLLIVPLLSGVLSVPSANAQNVIVVVLDGARYSEIFGSDSTYIPRMWNDLKPLGTIFTNFRNDGTTTTNPGHSSIESGTWQDIPNDGTLRPTMPSFFEYYRKHSGADDQSCFAVVGKSKLNVLTYSTHADYGQLYGSSLKIAANDKGVFDSLKNVMATQKPRLLLVNFPDIDVAGHSGSWGAYLAAIRVADSLVTELWATIQGDLFYKDSTTLVVTNDHGRHDDAHGGFQHHGDSCEGCRKIMLLAVGKGIPAGLVVGDTSSQIDIAPTVGELMAFPTPFALGTSMLPKMAVSGAHEDQSKPAHFIPLRNYPNPFNPATTLQVDLKDQSHVIVSITNALGEEIETIFNGVLGTGSHRLLWNAASHPSGLYVCAVVVIGSDGTLRRSVRKLMMVR